MSATCRPFLRKKKFISRLKMCIFRLKTYISSLKICISKLEIKHATGNRPLDKETKHEILLFRIQIPVNDKPLVMDIIQRRQALSAGCFKVQPPIRASDILSGTLSVALQDDRQICRYMVGTFSKCSKNIKRHV